MIENKNKKRANHGEFLQGGEPPLIGRARSSQKTPFLFVFTFSNLSCIFLFSILPFYDLYFSSNELVFFEPHLPFMIYIFAYPDLYFFRLSPMYIFSNHPSVFF